MTIINTGNNAKIVVKTDSSGNYSATPLKIGTYTVSVEAQGFKSVARNGIVLNVQDRLRVDFTLQIGSVSEKLVVTSSAPLLQSESSALGDVIESKQIADLPLNGRDYTQLASLTTGVVKVTESGNGLTGGRCAIVRQRQRRRKFFGQWHAGHVEQFSPGRYRQ